MAVLQSDPEEAIDSGLESAKMNSTRYNSRYSE
jgi:hypothetical protein